MENIENIESSNKNIGVNDNVAVCKGLVIGSEEAERIMACLESVSEASERVGVSKVAIYKRIKAGDLRCMRCYGVVIVDKSEVDALYGDRVKRGKGVVSE